jgi:hypothetical protein
VAVPYTHGPSPVMAIIAAACVYEIVAEAVNLALEMELLPSFSAGLGGLTMRRVMARAVIPPGVATAAGLGVGFAAHVAGGRRTRR